MFQSFYGYLGVKILVLVLHTHASKKAVALSLLYHPVLSVLLSEETFFCHREAALAELCASIWLPGQYN